MQNLLWREINTKIVGSFEDLKLEFNHETFEKLA